MESLYCHIYGRVQIVMFRDFTTRKARKCGIVGYVRNLNDGSVEAYGEGTKVNLQRWLSYLHRGSVLSCVERVDTTWDVDVPEDIPHKTFDSFDIVF